MILQETSNMKISAEKLFQELSRPEGFKKIMPDSLSSFNSEENGFNFTLKGMPIIYIDYLKKTPYSKIILSSSKKSSIKFNINFSFDTLALENTIEIIFEAKEINHIMKIMIEKPIKNLIKNFIEKIKLL